ncbi:ABC transporter ATP-binding protein [Peptoniphilus porci]|uniref:Spermidine/putrescine ABC transporter ATP-binding protein n=1 Tax=Peptoniphilus porci TaxID=2652280 RepID=A0A1U7LZK6_9FIRM|nr:ABC transporter ATP-binding protein [Peptoniphilus porci]OLR64788.1 spermidine/putrescine ABC transporter ATP-binding protein [Peptoniphilus porci]
MSKISLNNICKRYEENEDYSVKDFSIEINESEFIVFVGPSGCGKSTSLRMIAGLEDITSGELYIDGKLSNNVPPKDRNIAMVFQSYALYPHLTVYDNIAFGLKIRKLDKKTIDYKVKKTAEILNLTNYLKKKPKELSGGQMQRVALGRAIVKESDIFLMDEPLSNLDAKLRVEMRKEILNLKNKLGSTVIYVTHDQTEAMTMASRIVCLNNGIIQQIGTPRELYTNPINAFVAGFLGSPSMNFIEGKVKDKIFYDDDNNKIISGVNSHDGRVTLGIRPESIELSKEGDLPFNINLIELLGSNYDISGKIFENKIVLKCDLEKNPKNNGELFVKIPLEKTYLFDRDSGDRIFVGEKHED